MEHYSSNRMDGVGAHKRKSQCCRNVPCPLWLLPSALPASNMLEYAGTFVYTIRKPIIGESFLCFPNEWSLFGPFRDNSVRSGLSEVSNITFRGGVQKDFGRVQV